MAVATVTLEPTGPLCPSQHEEVALAHNRARKIRRAAAVAGFNGWTIGLFAACSLPFAFFSLPGLLIAAAMSLVAYNEFQGRRRLLAFDSTAATFLGWNQIGLIVAVVVYCLWMLSIGLTGENPLQAELNAKPELRAVFDTVDGLDETYRFLLIAVYGPVIAVSVLFQGLNAWYYFSRQKQVAVYANETPRWILDLQQLTSAS